VALRILRRYLVPHWRALTASILCAALFAGLSGLLLNLLQPAIDRISRHAGTSEILRVPIMIALLAIARGAAQAGQGVLVNRVGNGVVGDIQLELFGKMVRADLARLRAAHTGEFVSRVLYDSGLIREAATSGVVNLVQNALTLVAALVVMAAKDWRLSLLVLLAGPAIALLLGRFMRRATQAVKGAMSETGQLSTAIMEGLDGVRVVKMETREAFEEARVAAVIARRQGHILSGDNARALAAPASESMMMVVVAGVLAYEGWRASNGQAEIGAFVAFFAALLMAGQALRQVSNLLTVVSQGVTAGQRLLSALDVVPEVRDTPGAASLAAPGGRIRLANVSFAYAPGANALCDVSLDASRGEVVAIVGPSGAGKTTIFNLIPRFYDATRGAITIGDQDIREVSIASLRGAIALVTQDPFLFDDTIAANIAYGRIDATQADIEQAARAAAADDFIRDLPAGYQTLVGEAGARLSGGQRQRIAIARAFLKNAPILLLDEPTSALDTESEALVQAALTRLMAGRTTIIIAHRLSTVRRADRIYVLDKGQVVEVGCHDSLVKGDGLYARLAKAQDLTLPTEMAR